MANAQGADYSLWDNDASTPQRVDFAKARAAGLSFVGIKASQGNFADRDFLYNWQAAKDAGIPRMAYHYLTWSASVRDQVKFFTGLLAADPGELPPVIDYESRVDIPPHAVAASTLLSALSLVELETGKTPTVYTSPGFWAEYGSDAQMFAKYGLWIAHYQVLRPTVPAPWNAWTFWQYTDRGDGAAYGSEAKMVDLNWYNGTTEEMREEFAIGQTLPPAPTGDRWKLKAEVNIRTAPSTTATITGRLKPGEIITVTEYANGSGYVWAHHEQGWSAMYQYGFMEVA